MDETEIILRDEYIKLGQALKAVGVAQNGAEAKLMIQEGEVYVNGELENKRGKKLYDGDEVICGSTKISILKE